MKNSILNAAMVLAAITMTGCGADGPQPNDGPETGSLTVRVAALTSPNADPTSPQAADVRRVEVTVSSTTNGAYVYELALAQDAGGNTWSGNRQNVYAGDYTIEARAYDAVTDGNLIFLGTADQHIGAGSGNQVTIVLNAQTEDGSIVAPRFTSITLTRVGAAPLDGVSFVDQGQHVTITAVAEGGEGALSLSGRGGGIFHTASTGIDGSLDWEAVAPAADKNFNWFVLVLKDEAGNWSEVGVTVLVGPANGEVDVEVSFNTAPSLAVKTRILNDGDEFPDGGASMYVWAQASDDPAQTVGYHLDVSGCEAGVAGVDHGFLGGTAGAPVMVGPKLADDANGPALDGTWAYWKYQVGRTAAEGLASCQVKVIAADDLDASTAMVIDFDIHHLASIENP